MGRLAPKYPPEAIDALYRLVIDRELSVVEALVEIAATQGVEIVESTAYSYVQRERVRRSMEASPLPADQLEALGVLAQRWLDMLDAETRRIERGAKRGSKPLEVDRLRALARAAKEALPVFEMCRQSSDEAEAGGSGPADAEEISPGDEWGAAARLLAAHEADREEQAQLDPEPLERDDSPDRAAAIVGNGGKPIDTNAQARLQAYLDRRAAQREPAP